MSTPKDPSGDDFASVNRELRNLKFALDEAAILVVTDRNGIITYVNDKFLQMTRYSREELIGNTHRIIKSGYHSPEFYQDLWKTISSGKVWSGEMRNRRKDGACYWIYMTIVPFLDAQGNPEQYISIRYDINQRKIAERRLVEYASKLERSNRELQDFASIAAHDLQEPLRKIQAFADRVRKRVGDSCGSDTADYLERMQSAADRMQQLINDLLTYSRVNTTEQKLASVDLKEVIRDVLSDLEVRIEQTAANIKVGDLPVIEGDPVQMRQLFQNLIGNAVKFHKPNAAPEVIISSRKTGDNEVEISVADNGIGFDEKYLGRIFTIFQRLHGRQEYEGTGVGLAVCRRIVDRHSGSITARSELGKGSTFIVTLPLRKPNKEGDI